MVIQFVRTAGDALPAGARLLPYTFFSATGDDVHCMVYVCDTTVVHSFYDTASAPIPHLCKIRANNVVTDALGAHTVEGGKGQETASKKAHEVRWMGGECEQLGLG